MSEARFDPDGYLIRHRGMQPMMNELGRMMDVVQDMTKETRKLTAENDRLRLEVDTLAEELVAAKKRVAWLEEVLDECRSCDVMKAENTVKERHGLGMTQEEKQARLDDLRERLERRDAEIAARGGQG